MSFVRHTVGEFVHVGIGLCNGVHGFGEFDVNGVQSGALSLESVAVIGHCDDEFLGLNEQLIAVFTRHLRLLQKG